MAKTCFCQTSGMNWIKPGKMVKTKKCRYIRWYEAAARFFQTSLKWFKPQFKPTLAETCLPVPALTQLAYQFQLAEFSVVLKDMF